MVSYRPLVQPLPEINLDAYKVCLPPRWRPGELTFTSISVTFGTSLFSDSQHNFTLEVLTQSSSRTPLRCDAVDLLTFLIILAAARESRTDRSLGIPNILGVVLRDATIYFLLIVASQFLLFFFLFFAPVGDPYYISGWLILLCSPFAHVQTQIQLLPGV